LERIGDHIDNLVELAEYKIEHDLEFSDDAVEGLHDMFAKCRNVLKKTREAFEFTDLDLAKEVLVIEDQVNEMERVNRAGHIRRLNKGECDTEAGITFLDSLGNLERVSDHSSNIARYVIDKFK